MKKDSGIIFSNLFLRKKITVEKSTVILYGSCSNLLELEGELDFSENLAGLNICVLSEKLLALEVLDGSYNILEWSIVCTDFPTLLVGVIKCCVICSLKCRSLSGLAVCYIETIGTLNLRISTLIVELNVVGLLQLGRKVALRILSVCCGELKVGTKLVAEA